MILAGTLCRLRPYRLDDAEILAQIAGDVAVARWMTAQFPHPYALAAANAWVTRASAEAPVHNFAIDVAGTLAGGAGFAVHDGEHHGVAEFGYWLGRAYWGRGIATEAARLLVTHVFENCDVRRLEAHVFAPNRASVRVLEKLGFTREAVLREAYVERDGAVVDGYLYALLRTNWH